MIGICISIPLNALKFITIPTLDDINEIPLLKELFPAFCLQCFFKLCHCLIIMERLNNLNLKCTFFIRKEKVNQLVFSPFPLPYKLLALIFSQIHLVQKLHVKASKAGIERTASQNSLI